MYQHLIKPHRGQLTNLMLNDQEIEKVKIESKNWISWELTGRQSCDLELLLNGGFSPLNGFMCRKDYESVCSQMRLSDGTLWPIPIVLDVNEDFVKKVKKDSRICLRDPEGVMFAVLQIEEIWQPSKLKEAQSVYKTTNIEHPGVFHLLNNTNTFYIGGRLEGIQLPDHYDFRSLWLTPLELRNEFSRLGWREVIAFQTRSPMHRAHYELTIRAVKENEANLLIHPVTGMTKPGDIDHYTRIRCYQALLPHYPKHTAKLSLLPLAMRLAGPREALWHAIIRKNYGCSQLIVGRDHAGPGGDSSGKPFYDVYESQEFVQQFAAEIDMKIIPFSTMVYVEEEDMYLPENEVGKNVRTLSISGPELRSRLEQGRQIPHWFTFPEVAEELHRTYLPRHKQGFTVFFTGLSGSGKSTIAKVLLIRLLEMGGRPVTLLDGDIVRKNLSSELGFSKEHRDLNIRRIGFVANEITKNGGIAICAPIAPYHSIRKEIRSLIDQHGGFILVHIATPIEICEQRDRKGLYAKARSGILKEFTGISDPYEEPKDADMVIDTSDNTPDEAAQMVLLHLEHQGYIGGNID